MCNEEKIVSTHSLSKYFGSVCALDGVTLAIPANSIFGILGPNGSGKTTLLSILMSVLYPQSGSVSIMGQAPSNEVRKKIGCLLETPCFYGYMSAEDNLRIAAKIKDIDSADIRRVMERLDLWERRASKFSTFSLGMKQRLAIASALLGNPSLVVLDEPTNGLDPQGISLVRELIRELRKDGKTIIIASHLLDEVERVCTHVAILKKGKLLASGNVSEVLGNSLTFRLAAENNSEQLQQILSRIEGVISIHKQDGKLIVEGESSLTAEKINRFCFDSGIVLSHLEQDRKRLESWFIEVTQNT